MPSALIPLANTTLSANTTTVSFSSISGSYRDLLLVMVLKATGANTDFNFRINGDSGSNYSYVHMYGNGSTATTSAGTTSILASLGADITETTLICHFMDYSATDKHKPVMIRSDRAAAATFATANRWANTAAITSFSLATTANQFATGSTFALYGVSA